MHSWLRGCEINLRGREIRQLLFFYCRDNSFHVTQVCVRSTFFLTCDLWNPFSYVVFFSFLLHLPFHCISFCLCRDFFSGFILWIFSSIHMYFRLLTFLAVFILLHTFMELLAFGSSHHWKRKPWLNLFFAFTDIL